MKMKALLKRLCVAGIALCMAMTVGCTGGEQSAATTAEREQSAPESESVTSAQRTLVVYFSHTGNTQLPAQWIAEQTDGELYRITPSQAYSDNYDECAERAKSELDGGIRPELTALPTAEWMAQFDRIFVGFPIWWYDLPMSVTAFLERYELSGRTVIPFFTHNGSSSGAGSLDTLVSVCNGANVRVADALSIPGSSAADAGEQVIEWVKNLSGN